MDLVAVGARRRDAPLGRAREPVEGLPGLEAERTLTDWGRSERLTALADATLLGFLYHYWLRVECETIENVPSGGGALLVANRSGQLPIDGAMIARAVREEHPAKRQVQLAYDSTYSGLPGVGMTLTKLGAVRAHPANLQRLLFDEEQLVLLFPEGAAGRHKPLRSRYRLRRFAGSSFVEAAIRADVPIVPVAVLGTEESMPLLTSLAPLGRRLRLPLGSPLPLPAKVRLRFLQPVAKHDLQAAARGGGGGVQELTEAIRRLIQENLWEMVAERRSVWLG